MAKQPADYWRCQSMALACFFWLVEQWKHQGPGLSRLDVRVDPRALVSVGQRGEPPESDALVTVTCGRRLSMLKAEGLISRAFRFCPSCRRHIAIGRGKGGTCSKCGKPMVLVARLDQAALQALVGVYKTGDPPPPMIEPPETERPTAVERTSWEQRITEDGVPAGPIVPRPLDDPLAAMATAERGRLNAIVESGSSGGPSLAGGTSLQSDVIEGLEAVRATVSHAILEGEMLWEPAVVSQALYGPQWLTEDDTLAVKGVSIAVARCADAWTGGEVGGDDLLSLPSALRAAIPEHPLDNGASWGGVVQYLATMEQLGGQTAPLRIAASYEWFRDSVLGGQGEVCVSPEQVERMLRGVEGGRPQSNLCPSVFNWVYGQILEADERPLNFFGGLLVGPLAEAITNAVVIQDVARCLRQEETIFDGYADTV